MVLFLNTISQNHAVKVSWNYIDRSSSKQVTNLTSLVVKGTVVVEI